MASKRTRHIAGGVAGASVGAGGSAAVGFGIAKAAGAVVGRMGAGAAGLVVPGVGVALAAYTAYQGYKAARETAMSGASTSAIVRSAALGAIGITPAMAQNMAKAIGPEPTTLEVARQAHSTAVKAELRAAERLNGAKGDKARAKATEAFRKAESARVKAEKEFQEASSGAKPQAEAAKPEPKSSILSDIKGMFGGRDQRFVDRETDIRTEIKRLQAQQDREESRSKTPGRGQGEQFNKLRDQIDAKQGELKSLHKEERESNAFAQGFSTFAPIGATLGGLALGSKISGAETVAKQGRQAVAEIAKLASKADKLTSKSGLLAGTVSGDRARATVEAGRQAVGNLGRVSPSSYAWPAFNIAAGTGELYASGYHKALMGTDHDVTPTQQAIRIGGGFELGLGLGQLKAVSAAASAIRASSTALAKLGSAENRIARESAAGAGKASRAKVAGHVATARGAESVSRNKAATQVAGSAVTRDRARVPAVNAGSQLGMTRAKARGDVEVARSVASRRGVEARQDVTAARQGRTLSRPDGERVARKAGKDARYQPTRGRYYQRTYTSGPKQGITETVRKASA